MVGYLTQLKKIIFFKCTIFLRWHRERMEKYVAALESRLAAGSSRGEQKFMVQETEGDITELEDRMAEVFQLYGKKFRARAE